MYQLFLNNKTMEFENKGRLVAYDNQLGYVKAEVNQYGALHYFVKFADKSVTILAEDVKWFELTYLDVSEFVKHSYAVTNFKDFDHNEMSVEFADLFDAKQKLDYVLTVLKKQKESSWFCVACANPSLSVYVQINETSISLNFKK